MLTQHELKELHGKGYVDSFEKTQSKFRLERLADNLDLKLTDNVADFGCGNGMMLPLIAARVASYAGVDFSEEFISAALRRKESLAVTNAEFFCEDILEFCAKRQQSFDVAFAMDFSEHVYDDVWLGILKAIRSSLKAGGKLYIHTPNADFFLERMKRHNVIVRQFPEHIAVRNVKDNCDLLEKAGFEIVRVKLIPHYNVLRFLHPLSFIPAIGRFLKARIFIEATVGG